MIKYVILLFELKYQGKPTVELILPSGSFGKYRFIVFLICGKSYRTRINAITYSFCRAENSATKNKN